MTKDEQAIFDLIEKIKNIKDYKRKWEQEKERDKKLYDLMNMGLGKRSYEFINKLSYQKFKLWIAVEKYLYLLSHHHLKADECLSTIEEHLKTVREEAYKKDGRGMLPDYIGDGVLVKNVYLHGNESLLKLFQTYLPIPEARLFEGAELPPIIQEREDKRQKVIEAFNEYNKDNLKDAKDLVVMAQRMARGRQRLDEEVQRIKWRYNKDRYNQYVKSIIDDAGAKEIIRAANTPYTPQKCSPELAQRIVDASEEVELFATVRHLTATAAVPKILDTALFGRQTLKERYIPFRPASLFPGDIKNGDSKVICMAPNLIDDKCMRKGTTEIEINSNKLREAYRERPIQNLFFKQQDFGFDPEIEYEVRYGKHSSIKFTHTGMLQLPREAHKSLMMKAGYSVSSFAELPAYQLIAYDLNKIHQILCLNFFKYVDLLKCSGTNGPVESWETKSIYGDLEKLSHKELVKFLTDVGNAMTNNCEFNFSGAIQINIDWVSAFTDCDSGFVLKLPKFIAQLMVGQTEKFEEACKNLPQVFQSIRFLDYLLSKVENEASVAVLETHKASLQAETESSCKVGLKH